MFLSVCLYEHAHVRFFPSGLSVNAHICRLSAFLSLCTYACMQKASVNAHLFVYRGLLLLNIHLHLTYAPANQRRLV